MVFGTEKKDLVHRPRKILEAVPGKPGDQIGIDTGNSRFLGEGVAPVKIRHRMAAPHDGKDLVAQGLGIYADPRNAALGGDAQLFLCQRIGSSRLQRKTPAGWRAETVPPALPRSPR